MSTIDERVVELKLKSSGFQANAKKAVGVLQSLASALKLDKAAAGLGTLASKAKNFSLGNMGSEVDGISNKFSAMSVVAVTALATIANQAVNAGMNLAKSLTIAPITDGFNEYELKMSSIQTILANTARDGTKLKDVTRNLEELNTYADKTIYNFGQMTKNIGLFTNAGIGIDDATSMIKGFSNVAAASGTDANGAASAAYQLSQALSAGTIRLMDWKSLTNVGMGNANMRDDLVSIAEAMGTVKKAGTSGKKIQKNFNASLEDGWLTAGVMSKYLKIMAEDNQKLNRAQLKGIGITGKQADQFIKTQKISQEAAQKVRTFTQLLGTLREGVGSGWATSFNILFGDFNEATNLFTGIYEKVDKIFARMGDSRNELLSGWSKLGGRAALFEGIGNVFEALAIILGTVKDAFQTVFPPKTAADLANMSKSFRDFTETLKMGPENADRLRRIFQGLFSVVKVGVSIISGIAKALLGLFGIAQGGTGGFLELAATIGDFVTKIEQWLATSKAISNFFAIIDTARLNIMVPLIAIFGQVAEALSLLFKGDFEGFKAGMMDAFNGLGPLINNLWIQATKRITGFLGNVRDLAGIMSEFFKGVGTEATDKLSTALAWLSEKMGQLREIIRGLGLNIFQKGAKGASSSAAALSEAGSKVSEVFKSVKDSLSNVFSGIGDFFGPLSTSLINLLTTISTKVAEFIKNLDFEDAVALLNTGFVIMLIRSFTKLQGSAGGFFDSFKKIGDNISGVLTTIKTSVTDTFSTMQKSLKADILLKIAIAIGILALALVVLSRIDPKALTKAIIAVGLLMFVLGKSFGSIMGTMDEFNKTSPLAGLNVMAAGAALTMLAVAVLLLSFAVSKLSKLSWQEMAKGLISVGVIIAALTLFTKYATLDKSSFSGAANLLAMAIAVNLLSLAVSKLAEMDRAKLIQGNLAVIVLIATLTAAAYAMRTVPSGSVNLLGMAIALGLLIAPVMAFALLPIEKLTQGVGAVAILIATLALSAVLMSNPAILAGAAGMVLIAAALNMLIVPVLAFGLLPFEVLKQGMISLGIALGALVIAMMLLANPLALAGAMGLAIVAFGLNLLIVPITILGTLPWENVKQGLMALGIALGIVIIAGVLLIAAIPGLLGLGAAMVLIGAGAMLAGTGMLLFSIGLAAVVAVGTAGIALFTVALTMFLSFLPVIATQIGLAIRAFIVVIGQAGPEMVVAITRIFLTILSAIEKTLPKFFQVMDKLVKGLLTVVERNTPQFLRVITMFINGGLQVIQRVAPQFYATMITLIMGLVNAVVALAPRLAAKGAEMILNFIRVITQYVPKFAAAGTDFIIAIINAIAREVPRLADAGAKAIVKLINGVAAAVRNNSADLRAAGKNLAFAIIDGMTGGLASKVSAVTNAAKNVASKALSAAKNFLGIKSPSREFMKLGKYSSEGFAIGLQSNTAGIKKAIKTYRTMVDQAVAANQKSLTKLSNQLRAQERARNRDYNAIRKTKKALAEARAESVKLNRLRQKNGSVLRREAQLITLAKREEEIVTKIHAATDKLKEAIKVRDEYKKSTTETYSKNPEFDAETKLPDYINSLEKQIVDTQVFNAQLKELEKLGLNKEMYESIVSKGVTAMPFVTQILDKGKNGVNQLNSLTKSLDKSATNIGTTTSNRMYQAGVDSAVGLVRGLRSKREAINGVMEDIANGMVNTIKRTLGIRSPSREFAKIGDWSAKGLTQGFDKSAPMINASADKIGKTTIDTFRKSLSGLSDALVSDMDTDPTIRPILDLSALKKDASQIGSILGTSDITATASYSSAKDAAQNYRRPGDASGDNGANAGQTIEFKQYNSSPKALSEAEIYRNTKNQISAAKGALKV